jgi:oligopeptide transport system substrate-binding protein
MRFYLIAARLALQRRRSLLCCTRIIRSMLRHSSASLIAAVLLASLATLAGCGKRETPVDAALRTQTLLLGNGAEPQDLDPQIITAYTDYNIVIALFEGLTVIDETTSGPVPGAAARWEVSDDGLAYTFHLRPEARWSNGDPVTAADFVTSWQRMLSPALASEYAYMLHPLKNAEAYNTGALTDFSQVGAAAPDPLTLRLTLAHPTPHLLALLAHTAWFPVHPPTILKHGKLDQRGTAWTRPGNLVGNGPFVLAEWSPNNRIVVTKNPLYHGAARNRLRAVVFFPNDNIATDEHNFRAGQVHITYDLLPEKIPAWRRAAPESLRIDPLLETFFLRFNIKVPPLDQPAVRRALALALDREVICRDLLHGSRQPAHFFTPPNTAGYTSAARVPTDFDAARRLLAGAGFPGGKGFPVLEIQMNTDAVNQKVLQAIQEMWRRELGINVTLANRDFRVYLDHQRTMAYQISRSRWVGDYNDPGTYLDMFVTDGGNNQTHWSNPGYDRLIAAANRTLDRQKRDALFQRAEAILLDGGPVAPVFFGTRVFLIHPDVKGWTPSLLGIHRYQNVWLER